VGTVGKLAVLNGAVNVIPGQCEFTIGLRAGDNETRDAALQRVFEQIESIARRRNVGAGHDAMKMASLTEVGMLFVRCGNEGISHHPAESMTAADAELAARVFSDFLITLQDA
jgi:acetylornithine deacetylase/succinyl-diaminopimelate desuccinylase-like protein